MIDEELEFRISQYADGTLPADEVAALEATLASDAEARAMLESYRKLGVAIKRELAIPAINWDRLAGHLSGGIDRAEAQERSNYTIRLFTFGHVAVAAMVLLAVGSVAWLTLRPAGSGETNPNKIAVNLPSHPQIPPVIAVAELSGPAAEAAALPSVEEVAIGPSPAAEHVNYAAAEDIVYRTPRVVIASSQFQRQDSASLPF